ncbi:MAG: hypothetical protein KC441_07470, partial [Anaerolineales bacterium]|nr:hypothetical protein [Anaerolineales bacterium]
LTGTNFPNNTKPIYYAYGVLINTPAVGDIDNDGKLELVASNSSLYVWDLNQSTNRADWPMFKKNPARTATEEEPSMMVSPGSFAVMVPSGSSNTIKVNLRVANTGPGSFDWQANATPSNGVSMLPTSGTVSDEKTVQVSINPSGLGVGVHDYVIHFEGSVSNKIVAGSPINVTIRVVVANHVHKSFLPMITK